MVTHLTRYRIDTSMKWVSIGSGNGLAPNRRQAINWPNAGLSSIGKTPVRIILVVYNKNAHKGMFPHSTTRARGQVPEMLYIFV